MLEVIFLGVGEAFDEALPNTSILIRHGIGASRINVLLDCGFTAPTRFWREEPEADSLDGVWISHFHGDHAFGLPALLVRFWEERRTKELTVIGQKGIETFSLKCLDLAYPGFHKKLTYPLRFMEVEPGKLTEIFGLSFQTAENDHSQRDLALRIDIGGNSVFYSGDGKPTPESTDLAMGCQLIIQEAFHLDTEIPGHGTVTGAIDMAKKCEAFNLALVHIHRKMRSQVVARIQQLKDVADPVNVLVPEPRERIKL